MTARRQALADLIDDRGERILRTALSLTALLLIGAIVAGHLGGQGGASRMVIRYLMFAVSVGALLALRSWGVGGAVRLFLFGSVAMLLGQGALVSGVRTPVLLAMPSLLVLSGWFLGRREAIALGAVAAIGVSAMGALEALGLLRPQPRDALDYLVTLLVVLPVSSVIGLHAHGRFVHQLGRAQEGAHRLERELDARERAEHDARARNEDLRLIHELSARVHPLQDVESILRVAIDAIVEVTRAGRVVTYLFEPDGIHLRLVASHGFDAAYERIARTVDVRDSWSGRALKLKRPLVARDISREPRFARPIREALLERGLHGAVVLPLLDQALPLGCVALFYPPGELERDGPAEMESFEAVGRTLSMAIVNVRNLAHLRHLARHDALTGLPNRAVLHEGFAQLDARIGAGARPAMMLLDLDRFKDINDTLGHHIGDRLLASLSQRLAAIVGPGDALTCRLGGDEFAVLLHHVESVDQALLRARAIRDALGQPFEVDGMGLKVGASIGVALYPDHGTDSHQLLRAADVAMYRSKTRSLGVSLYDRSADTHSADRLALVAELADAVTRGELVLYYQPKLDLRDGRIAGVEALVRWQHPRRGLLLPGAFIQLAEASEVIHPFTRAVMDLAMTDCAKLRRHGLRQSVALNLSARNLVDDRCVQDLEQLIALHGLAYGDIELEITETAILHDPALVGRLLDRLDGQGVGLALDDFGTGYSSLAHLKRLPLDALKVDRSFVRDMTTDEQDAIIVRSTIALAHNLGMLVIAEGVEDADTEQLLRRMDCDMIQGYHVARPMPLDELIAWLGARGRESPSQRDATDATHAIDATNGPVVSARRPAGLPEYQ